MRLGFTTNLPIFTFRGELLARILRGAFNWRVLIALPLILAINCKPKSKDSENSNIAQTRKNWELESSTDADSAELVSFMNSFDSVVNIPTTVDSVFTFNDKNVRVIFKHYSLGDSKISIHEKYLSMYGLRKFEAPNFESSLIVLEENGSKVIDTTIRKDIFNSGLPVELVKYGVLLYPSLDLTKDKISIDYSISIPLTDIGSSATFLIMKDGRSQIKFD